MLSVTVLAFVLGLPPTEFPHEKTGTFQRTFDFDASGPPEIEIDNVQGSIELVGYDGASVQLAVRESFRARSQERLDLAQQQVKLLVSQEENRLRLYVDGPFRRGDGSNRYRGPEDYGYEVTFGFALRVPRHTNLVLKTINDGEIRVDAVSGIFDVKNVNGGISITNASGSGRAYAVNGDVSVVFAENPAAASYFGSLNGDVSAVFEADLSARLMVKTFNGDLYTDFPTTYLRELPPIDLAQRHGKKVYESSGYYGLQVGAGGPPIELDAFNGDIRVLKRGLAGRR
ncbi:MAG TPA: hypothetical protein VEK15_02070 [Vicinamibacteria bacterium]|nr:hypothetical protein [Vicinamibacteria bacterium]